MCMAATPPLFLLPLSMGKPVKPLNPPRGGGQPLWFARLVCTLRRAIPKGNHLALQGYRPIYHHQRPARPCQDRPGRVRLGTLAQPTPPRPRRPQGRPIVVAGHPGGGTCPMFDCIMTTVIARQKRNATKRAYRRRLRDGLRSLSSRFPSFFEETGVIKESWTWRFFCEKNQKPPIRWK